jgi:hypothetical protein
VSPSRNLFVAGLALWLGIASLARAFNLSGQRWANGQVVMQLQLGPVNRPLLDGATSWDAVAEDALASWNSNLSSVQFSAVRNSTAAIARGNRLNNVFWSSTVYGDAWDTRTLGITLSTYDPRTSRYSETDVIFNSTVQWDSYRGPLRTASPGVNLNEFRRVALHEFGHALGLNHPDDVGQTVTAIMNARSSNVDALTPDDIAGARAIYDNPNNPPATLLSMQGSVGFSTSGSNLTLRVARIQNDGDATSGTLRLELWAMPQHFDNGLPVGSRNMGIYAFPNPLAPAASLTDVNVSTTYTSPPNGSYYVVLLLTEFTGGSTNSGYTIRDSIEFTNTLNIGPPSPPGITSQPANVSVVAGGTATFSVAAVGSLPLTYQWRKDGAALSGATNSTLTLSNVQSANAGGYTVVVSNSLGSTTSNTATLTLSPGTGGGGGGGNETNSRLSNLSVRTAMAAGQTLIVGFSVSGGSRSLLVRGVGPTLGAFGVAGAMADPRIELYNGTTLVAQNEDWGNSTALSTAAANVGAFALQANSRDAAFLQTVEGSRTVQLKGTGAGVALVELYDTGSGNSPRLVNVSARNQVGTGDNILIVGFVIAGTDPKRVLIRGVGPTLASFGLTGVLSDPRFDVFRSGSATAVASNDNWDASLASTFTAVGAFSLTAGSRDAALVTSLEPGAYTVQVSGANNGTGEALVEIYEVP